MAGQIEDIGTRRVLFLDGEVPLSAAMLSNDLIGLTWSDDAQIVAVPIDALPDNFFDLRSGVIGEVAQKFVNYHLMMVVIGDITHFQEASNAFREYVRETNAGTSLWFVPNADALRRKLDTFGG